jgi:hypothetical protein
MVEIIASALVLAVMGVAAFSLSGDAYWTDFSPGPAFMPYWIAGFGAVIACLLIYQSIRNRLAVSNEIDFSDLKPAGFVIVLLGLLLAVMPWAGMIIGSSVMILVILVGMQRRPIWPSLVTAAVTAAIVYGVFEIWLNIDLPRSPLGI